MRTYVLSDCKKFNPVQINITFSVLKRLQPLGISKKQFQFLSSYCTNCWIYNIPQVDNIRNAPDEPSKDQDDAVLIVDPLEEFQVASGIPGSRWINSRALFIVTFIVNQFQFILSYCPNFWILNIFIPQVDSNWDDPEDAVLINELLEEVEGPRKTLRGANRVLPFLLPLIPLKLAALFPAGMAAAGAAATAVGGAAAAAATALGGAAAAAAPIVTGLLPIAGQIVTGGLKLLTDMAKNAGL